jgi:hypothetical protein
MGSSILRQSERNFISYLFQFEFTLIIDIYPQIVPSLIRTSSNQF